MKWSLSKNPATTAVLDVYRAAEPYEYGSRIRNHTELYHRYEYGSCCWTSGRGNGDGIGGVRERVWLGRSLGDGNGEAP